jgi:hypothetical protein
MMRWMLTALAVLAIWPTAAMSQQRCFDITVGDWFPMDGTHTIPLAAPPRPDQGADSVEYSLPPRIGLHDVPASLAPQGWRRVSVPPNALQVPHSHLGWRPSGTGMVLVVSNGMGGTISTLRRAQDGWKGKARTFSDYEGVLQFEHSVHLRRVDCESEPPIPASADKRLPRSVELRETTPLVLGSPLPAGVTTHPRSSGAKTVEASPTGRWEGVDTVVVRIDREGRVSLIELRYPGGFDLSPLHRGLERDFGPGTSLSRSQSLFWHNRTTSMYVSLRSTRPRFAISDPRGG